MYLLVCNYSYANSFLISIITYLLLTKLARMSSHQHKRDQPFKPCAMSYERCPVTFHEAAYFLHQQLPHRPTPYAIVAQGSVRIFAFPPPSFPRWLLQQVQPSALTKRHCSTIRPVGSVPFSKSTIPWKGWPYKPPIMGTCLAWRSLYFLIHQTTESWC